MRPILITSIVALTSSALCASPESWPRFRGPNGSGIAVGSAALPTEIGPEKNVVWKIRLAPGHSSPVVAGDRLYLTAQRDKRLFTVALDADGGDVVWEREAKYSQLERIHSIGSYAQPSVATDGEHVVSLFGSSGLLCYDRSGTLLWHLAMGPFNDDFGTGSSPLIARGRVILSQDHDTDSFLMAVDLETGDVIWKTDRSEFPRSYATPILWETKDSSRQIVVPGTLRAVGYDFDSGGEVWTVRGLARIVNPTAVVGEDGTLYMAAWAPGGDSGDRIRPQTFKEYAAAHDADSSGTLALDEIPEADAMRRRFRQIDRDKDGRITREEYEGMRHIFETARNVVTAVRPGGKGDITSSHVLWTYARGVPYVPSPLYHDGCLFLVKNGGIVTSLDAASGDLVKQGRVSGRGNYYSSPVYGDGKIYLLSERGEASVISAEREWKLLSSASFKEDAYATPAVVRGRIYLRTSGHLYCFGLSPGARSRSR